MGCFLVDVVVLNLEKSAAKKICIAEKIMGIHTQFCWLHQRRGHLSKETKSFQSLVCNPLFLEEEHELKGNKKLNRKFCKLCNILTQYFV